jgi:RNA polymerase sigma-70 factor (ECF subfamily)
VQEREMTKKTGCENLDQKIQEGEFDQQLMDSIAQCLSEDVRRFALSRCGDGRADVEDITQDAMMAAQRYLSSFRGDASLRTWLYKLVMSACSRHRRGRKNDPALHRSLEDAPQHAQVEPVDPEVSLMISERLGALEQALGDLRAEDRDLLSAAEWEGLSLEQVAKRYDLTVSAVKSRLFRIRRQLKDSVTSRFADTTR